MAFEIVGREEDVASVRAFVGEAPPQAALVLEGEAGIGKSTLWLAGVEEARAHGARVLVARPAEAERGLALAGLGDLFDDVLDEVLPRLSAPRRSVLEAGLLLSGTGEEDVNPRALGLATRDALRLLAADTTVLVAVDDVQWLDASTADALAFALRRLEESRVIVLLARRIEQDAGPSELEQALQTQRLWVEALSVGAVHRLLHERVGRTFGRQTVLRIHERS